MSSGFDRLAKPYRWMEYLTFGRALERCRFALLQRVCGARHALLLGDGDGRFAARLLAAAPQVHITAVDASSAMLQALRDRCVQPGRVTVRCLDLAHDSLAAFAGQRFDLVVSHFVLDCFTYNEVERLVEQIKPMLMPQARWVVSEFQIPAGWMRLPAGILVRVLYAAFGVLTGLRITRLPDHASILRQHGFACTARLPLLRGLLIAEEWQLAHEV